MNVQTWYLSLWVPYTKERQIAKHIISISQGVPLKGPLKIYLPAFLRVTAVRILTREHENFRTPPEDIRRPSSEEFWGRSEYFQRCFKYFLVSVPRRISPPKSLWLVFFSWKIIKLGKALFWFETHSQIFESMDISRCKAVPNYFLATISSWWPHITHYYDFF